MQQSAAFKILRTRLKTVPSYSFNGEHQGWNTPSETSHSRVSNHVDSRPHCTQDGVMTQDVESMCNGINFDSRLQQFQHMQQEHRIHAKAQAQLRKSSVTSTKVENTLFPWLLFTLIINISCHCTVLLGSECDGSFWILW